ncbi:hypothetical protein BH23PLA1_BH23PLA1_23930 [soil metagenome]
MSEHEKQEYTGQDIAKAKGGYDPETLASGGEPSRQAERGGPNPIEGGPPQMSGQDQAEQQAQDEKAQPTTRDRDGRLIVSGRGRHTTGRLGGVQ